MRQARWRCELGTGELRIESGSRPPKMSRESSVSSRISNLPAVALATAATASGAGCLGTRVRHGNYRLQLHRPLFILSLSGTCLCIYV
jgi:hypothetical protein